MSTKISDQTIFPGGEGVRGRSAVGQQTSLIFASYRWSFDVYSRRVCTAMDSYIIGAII